MFTGRGNNNKRIHAFHGDQPDGTSLEVETERVFNIRHGLLQVHIFKREHLYGDVVRCFPYLGIDKLFGNIGQRDDPVKAAFFNKPDAVQPEDNLDYGKDFVFRDRRNGPEIHPPFHLGVDDVVRLEDIAEDRLDHFENIGVVEKETDGSRGLLLRLHS